MMEVVDDFLMGGGYFAGANLEACYIFTLLRWHCGFSARRVTWSLGSLHAVITLLESGCVRVGDVFFFKLVDLDTAVATVFVPVSVTWLPWAELCDSSVVFAFLSCPCFGVDTVGNMHVRSEVFCSTL